MKKLFPVMVVCACIVSSAVASAQSNMVARTNKQTLRLNASALQSVRNFSRPTGVSERVSQRFAKQFPDIAGAVWIKSGDGFLVRFTAEGVQNWVFLTRQGNCQSHILYYTEKDLPAEVRHQVKRAYYDFVITSIKEVRDNKVTAYLVTIADATQWKVIRVVDGESMVWEEHENG